MIINSSSKKRRRQSKNDNGRSYVKMFKDEMKKLDEVLSTYDNDKPFGSGIYAFLTIFNNFERYNLSFFLCNFLIIVKSLILSQNIVEN